MPFETTYICGDCSHKFMKRTDYDPRKKSVKQPACVKCKNKKQTRPESYTKLSGDVKELTQSEKEARFNDMLESRQPPASGFSNFTKAMDTTAEIVMKDYGLTNLQDNLRAGDSMAPKLEHRLEQRVDGVFKPQKPLAGMQGASTLNKNLMSKINSGMFKGYGGADDVVAKQQASGIRKPTNIMFDFDNRK